MNESPGWTPPGSSPSDPDGPSSTPPHAPSSPTGPSEQSQPHGWSQVQPPAAAPSGWGASGHHQAPGGPGGPGGQWHHGWQAPPSAKPGVVPLRPLGVGEVLDGAISTMRAHWRPVLGIALGIAIVVELISTVSTGLWSRDATAMQTLQDSQNPTVTQVTDAYNEALSAQIVPMVAAVVAGVLATAMLTLIISRAVLGQSVTVGEAWQGARPLLSRLLGLSLLIPLIVVAAVMVGLAPGLLLAVAGGADAAAFLMLMGGMAGVVVAVWLWVRFCLAAPALMLERQGILTALRRSAKLVKGSWWRVCGIQLLAVLLVLVLSFVIAIPTTLVASVFDGGDGLLSENGTSTGWTYLVIMGIGAVVSSTVTLPFTAGVTALLYIDRRIRREARDLELARAAGVPGYGAPPTQPDRPTFDQ